MNILSIHPNFSFLETIVLDYILVDVPRTVFLNKDRPYDRIHRCKSLSLCLGGPNEEHFLLSFPYRLRVTA